MIPRLVCEARDKLPLYAAEAKLENPGLMPLSLQKRFGLPAVLLRTGGFTELESLVTIEITLDDVVFDFLIVTPFKVSVPLSWIA